MSLACSLTPQCRHHVFLTFVFIYKLQVIDGMLKGQKSGCWWHFAGAGGPVCVKQAKDQILVPTFLSPACFNQKKIVYFLVCYLWL